MRRSDRYLVQARGLRWFVRDEEVKRSRLTTTADITPKRHGTTFTHRGDGQDLATTTGARAHAEDGASLGLPGRLRVPSAPRLLATGSSMHHAVAVGANQGEVAESRLGLAGDVQGRAVVALDVVAPPVAVDRSKSNPHTSQAIGTPRRFAWASFLRRSLGSRSRRR